MIGLPASTIFPKSIQSFVKCELTNLVHSSGNPVKVEVSVAQMTGTKFSSSLVSKSVKVIEISLH